MWSGAQSIGKRWMRLRVVHVSGSPASTRHVMLVRNLPFLLHLLIPYTGAYFYLIVIVPRVSLIQGVGQWPSLTRLHPR